MFRTGGYKLSALDVERELLTHPGVADAAVVGVPDPVWGEVIGAVVAVVAGHQLGLQEVH